MQDYYDADEYFNDIKYCFPTFHMVFILKKKRNNRAGSVMPAIRGVYKKKEDKNTYPAPEFHV